jgi:hypothetical protein
MEMNNAGTDGTGTILSAGRVARAFNAPTSSVDVFLFDPT